MTCSCKNEDGSLSPNCIGQCTIEKIVIQNEEAKRDPLNGFSELILSQVEKRIDYKLSMYQIKMQGERMTDYNKAFIEGMKEGIEMGIRIAEQHNY